MVTIKQRELDARGGKLASTPYFNKLLPSIFRQVRRQERAILASTYYTGCVHSILG